MPSPVVTPMIMTTLKSTLPAANEEKPGNDFGHFGSFWTSYIDGTSIYNDVNGDPVVTEKAFIILSAVPIPMTCSIRALPMKTTKTPREVPPTMFPVKIVLMLMSARPPESIMENGLAYGEAVVSGHSYTTYYLARYG